MDAVPPGPEGPGFPARPSVNAQGRSAATVPALLRDARHAAVVDLGFGDAGKGTTVDHLTGPAGPFDARRQDVHVVRFNGGAQAAHNVVTPDGRHHAFAQFGSGTLHGARTLLSRFVLVEPLSLAAEALHLRSLGVTDPFSLISVDERCLLTTPVHRAANRAREAARGPAVHGSCGLGVGETVSYALAYPKEAPRVADVRDPGRVHRMLEAMIDRYRTDPGLADGVDCAFDAERLRVGLPELVDAYTAFAAAVTIVGPGHLARLLATGRVVFEGAQGVLLDEWRGLHPYTTWSSTTFDNVDALLAETCGTGAADACSRWDVARLGVTRAYATRHGPGPLVTEDDALSRLLPEPHNATDRWQDPFRVGHLDLVALRYAAGCVGRLDGLVLTHLDSLSALPRPLVADAYRLPSGTIRDLALGTLGDLAHQERLTAACATARPLLRPTDDLAGEVEAVTGAPVVLRSFGPTWADKVTVPPSRSRVRGPGRQ